MNKKKKTKFKIKKIYTKAPQIDRYKQLKKIIKAVLKDTDPAYGKKKKKVLQKRKWILWFFLYLIWWEGCKATKRRQGGKGPARGLIQIEPDTLKDRLKQYILKGKKKTIQKRIKNLAETVCGIDPKKMEKALVEFIEKQKGKKWPKSGEAKKLEYWLIHFDTFAIKIMRYYFKSYRKHSFYPRNKRNKKPQNEKCYHAENWYKYWKKTGGNKQDLIEKFVKRSECLDKVSRGMRGQHC